MSKNHFFYKALLLFVSTVTLFSCSSDDEQTYGTWTPPSSWSEGALVLNQGNYGSNNSLLSYYNTNTNICNPTVFESANKGLHLGDTGQSLMVADNYIYVSVYGSGVIYILNKQGQIIKRITSENQGLLQKPRYLAQDANYVYVTYYDGYLGRISKSTQELDVNQVKVGNYPEGLAVANGNIYVANSGGLNYPNYDKTVSVVNASTFTIVRDIDVVMNPTKVEADNIGNVYVVSMGNYDTVLNTLQRINTDFTVDSIGRAILMTISPDKNKLYTMYSQSGDTIVQARVYDTAKREFLTTPFIQNIKFEASPCSLNLNPLNNEIYIGTSDYRTNAEMYKFAADGKFITKFNTEGLNPTGIYFIQ